MKENKNMKRKIGIVVDSSVALTKVESSKLGLYFVPIIIDYEGKEFESGVDIDNQYLWDNLTKESKVKTAAVKPAAMEAAIKKASEENDVVFVWTISKHLSSINDTSKLIGKKYSNVEVLDSEMTPPWSNAIILDIVKAAKSGDVEKTRKILTSQDNKMFGYLLPSTMDSLFAGGRVSKRQYLLGTLAKIKPIIPVINGSMADHPAMKARGAENARRKAVKAVMAKFEEYKNKGISGTLFILKSNDTEATNDMKEAIKESGYKGKITETILDPANTVQIGPRSVGVGILLDY